MILGIPEMILAITCRILASTEIIIAMQCYY